MYDFSDAQIYSDYSLDAYLARAAWDTMCMFFKPMDPFRKKYVSFPLFMGK